ncbi:hypothetical protein KJE20_14101 [Pyrenophora tritici-repentis]|nr:hypothetical protein KJE20_14101 [Pyrenophora tritici-repentis]
MALRTSDLLNASVAARIRMRLIWKNIEGHEVTFPHMSAEVVADILQWLSTTLPFANVAIAASSVSAWISLKTTTLLLGIVSVRNATSPSKARALGKITAR